MSLLWKTAAAYQIEAAVKPRQYTAEMHPDDISKNTTAQWDGERLKSHERWGPVIKQLTESIQQHGYSPERHGRLSLNLFPDGRRQEPNVSSEAAEGVGMHPRLWEGRGGTALTVALQNAGHGPVPVHVTDERPDPKAKIRYFHGTTAEGLDEIHPNDSSRGNFGVATHEPGYAYATPNKEDAWSYATKAADEHGGRPRMYEVKPTGPVEEDPMHDPGGYSRGNYVDDKRSKHHFTVVREHKPPRDIHKEYYADEPWEKSR